MFRSETIATHLVFVVVVVVVVVGVTCSKKQTRHCFKSDQNEIWQDCSSSSSIDGVRFSICHPIFDLSSHFKMAAIISFHATKCCHLVSQHEACAGAYAAASDL